MEVFYFFVGGHFSTEMIRMNIKHIWLFCALERKNKKHFNIHIKVHDYLKSGHVGTLLFYIFSSNSGLCWKPEEDNDFKDIV